MFYAYAEVTLNTSAAGRSNAMLLTRSTLLLQES